MGQIEVVQNSKIFDSKPLLVDLQFGIKVLPQFAPLTNWPLNKIRTFYDHLKHISGPDNYKYVSLRAFQELLMYEYNPLFAQTLYKHYDKKRKKRLNVLQFLSALIWTSYSTKSQKINFIFRMFDFDKNGTLTIDEMILIFTNTIKSLSKITGTEKSLPHKSKLVQASNRIFKQADVDNSDSLSVEEIKQWIESRKVFVEFIERFEPKSKVYYQPSIFLNFPEIKINEIKSKVLETMGTLQQISKDTQSIKMKYVLASQQKSTKRSQEDILETFYKNAELPSLHKQPARTLTTLRSVGRFSSSRTKINIDKNMDDVKLFNKDFLENLKPQPSPGFMTQRFSSQQSTYASRLNTDYNKKLSVLTIQGKTYSKKDIIELKHFYDIMDREDKGYITYEDYARNFKLMSNSLKHAKNVFETLDKRKKGQLTLEDFVKVSIPFISEKQLDLVFEWMRQPNKYNENMYTYNSAKRRQSDQNLNIIATQQDKNSNLKVIPKQTVKEFLRIYDIYNTEKSGLLSIDDLKRFLLGTYEREDLVEEWLKRKSISLTPVKEQPLDQSIPQNENPGDENLVIDDDQSDFSDIIKSKIQNKLNKKQTINVEQFLTLIKPPDGYISSNTLLKIKNQYHKKVRSYQLKQVDDLKAKIRAQNLQQYQREQYQEDQQQQLHQNEQQQQPRRSKAAMEIFDFDDLTAEDNYKPNTQRFQVGSSSFKH